MIIDLEMMFLNLCPVRNLNVGIKPKASNSWVS